MLACSMDKSIDPSRPDMLAGAGLVAQLKSRRLKEVSVVQLSPSLGILPSPSCFSCSRPFRAAAHILLCKQLVVVLQ